MPPPESRVKRAKTEERMDVGIYRGYVNHAGGLAGVDSYVCPLSELTNLNMKTGREPNGKRPIIERSDQVVSAILDHTLSAEERSPRFPLKEAYERAKREISSVHIPEDVPPEAFLGGEPTVLSPRRRAGRRCDA